MEEQKELFRKKPLEKISNPNQLNEYIKVSSPSIWTVLIAAIVLLVGLLFWGIFGSLESSVPGVAIVSNNHASIYFSPDQAHAIQIGTKVRVKDAQGVLKTAPGSPQQIPADFDAYALSTGKLKAGDWKTHAEAELPLSDGIYDAALITESIRPITFLIQ